MEQKKRIVALVPLRGGSKSIPYKNIKDIAGKPLAYWTLKAACEAKDIDAVYVSTEDQKIKDVVLSLGLDVKVVDRPHEFAEDTSSTESVMLHFAEVVDFDMLLTLQATSPLTTSADIDAAFGRMLSEGYDSLLTGVLTKRFYWTLDGIPLNYNYLHRPRRQDFPGTVVENGAFYITKRSILLENKNRLGGKIGIYHTPEDTYVEIDEPTDWSIVEKLLLDRQH